MSLNKSVTYVPCCTNEKSLLDRITRWFDKPEKIQDPRTCRERMEFCREVLDRILTYQGFWLAGELGEPVLACLDPDREGDLFERWIIRRLPRKPLEELAALSCEPPAERDAWLFSWELIERYPGSLASGCCWISHDMAVFQIGSGSSASYIKVRVPPKPARRILDTASSFTEEVPA